MTHPTVERLDLEAFDGASVRRPSSTFPVEAPLARCNERSRLLGQSFVDTMFDDLPILSSSQAADGSTFAKGRASPTLVRELRSEEHLATIFQRCQFEVPTTARFVKDLHHRPTNDLAVRHPGPFSPGRTRLRLAAMAGALADGFTMVLDGFDVRDSAMTIVAEMFERVYACPVNINGYLSTRTFSSFGAHWDEQDVVIVQLLGQKRWAVFEPSALSPLQDVHPEGASGEPIWEGVLEPGDTLFIPRGWPHLVTGLDQTSFHHTITMPRLRPVDALEGAASQLDPPFAHIGGEMPMLPTFSPAPILLASSAAASLASLRDATIARLQFERIASRSTRALDLREPIAVGERVRCPCPGGIFVSDRTTSGLLVGLGTCVFDVPSRSIAALADICDGNVRLVTDDNLRVVRSLSCAGMVERFEGLVPWWQSDGD